MTRDDLNRAQAIVESADRLLHTPFAKQRFMEAAAGGQTAKRGDKNPYPEGTMLNAAWSQGQVVARQKSEIAYLRKVNADNPVAMEANDE